MKTILQGIQELAAEDYHALGAINKTGLDYIAKSPAHYQAYLKLPKEQTDAMVIGTATHYGVFQPELLYKNFYARPDGLNFTTKEGKAARDKLLADNPGKIMIKHDEMAQIEGMMRAVRSHATASSLISGGRPEMSAICQDKDLGVLCKARPDYLRSDDIMIDLKTAETANFFNFQRKVKDYRYHVQAAWYLDVVNAAIGQNHYKRFILLVIEKHIPHGIILYELDPDAIRLGRMEARQNLKTYAECLKSDRWPGYPEHIMTMTVPTYE